MDSRQNIFGLALDEIVSRINEIGLPAYRGRQVYRWIYGRGATRFSEMTDIPVALRETLERRFLIRLPTLDGCHRSRDGTTKYLFSLEEKRTVEAVHIPEPAPVPRSSSSRHTLCLSTQVGCPLRCTFCYSGTVPFSRNLTPGEVLGQFLQMKRDLTPPPTRVNVVFMGMGEPLLNMRTVLTSLAIMTDPEGFAVSPRRITVSTAGLARELDEFVRLAPPVGLAVSLHAATSDLRGRLMPINRKYPLETLIETLRRLPLPKRRRITLEYVLLGGENDSEKDALELTRLLHGVRSKINLIVFNPWPGAPHRASTPEATERFTRILAERGYTVSLRRSRGEDILGACGQLAGRAMEAVESRDPSRVGTNGTPRLLV